MYVAMTGRQCNIYTQNLILYTCEQNFHWICPCKENFSPTKSSDKQFWKIMILEYVVIIFLQLRCLISLKVLSDI